MDRVLRKTLLAAATGLLLGLLPLDAVAGDLPGADAAELWQYMTRTNPYTGWGYWPGKVGVYEGTRPHGAKLVLYANAPALKAAREGRPMPYGAIVVKENYGPDGKQLMAVTPMYRVEGYNPEAGDWFWAKYDGAGKALKSGKVDGCINCHRARAAENWIFAEQK
jgi:hypothetical protein